jgi:anti-sigma regulatory factor (Ser/Thr protein kinase)
VEWSKTYERTPTLVEDAVWDIDVKPFFSTFERNMRDIWYYGFTEMFNNAIDHSESSIIQVVLTQTAINTKIEIKDEGAGIFHKIQTALNLHDERHAVVELAKGKFTTEPSRHSGQGIFFTSRLFDRFEILSGRVSFSHQWEKEEDWIQETREYQAGTVVALTLRNDTQRTTKELFDQFTVDDDYGFTKTVVPVSLAQLDENLVSRSQAKRLLARVEQFCIVVMDFKDVDEIGQAFADEIFRVFRHQYPDVVISHVNANSAVQKMIRRAESN